MVFLRNKKEEAGIRVPQGDPQQISFADPGPPVVIEDHGRRLFLIVVYPRGKGLRFPNFDRGWGGQRRRCCVGVRFVRGLSGVGPLAAVSRALGLSPTGSRHPVTLVRLSVLTPPLGGEIAGLPGVVGASGLVTDYGLFREPFSLGAEESPAKNHDEGLRKPRVQSKSRIGRIPT